MGYKTLEIWKLARELSIDIHRIIIYALASTDETIDHLETLYETESLTDEILYEDLSKRLHILGKKINSFLKNNSVVA